MAERKLNVPLRDDVSEHRGYDVAVYTRSIDFSMLEGYVSEIRFAVRDEAGEVAVPEDNSVRGKGGHLVTDSPGDPKVIPLPRGDMFTDVADLVGDCGSYVGAHGGDPSELVLSSDALARREKIVDELVDRLTQAMELVGPEDITRLRRSFTENITVELKDLENKFGIGLGRKTFTKNESLLNEKQEAFVRKRDAWLTQLENMVVEKLRPSLVARDLLNEADNLAINFHDNHGHSMFAEINMPRRLSMD